MKHKPVYNFLEYETLFLLNSIENKSKDETKKSLLNFLNLLSAFFFVNDKSNRINFRRFIKNLADSNNINLEETYDNFDDNSNN